MDFQTLTRFRYAHPADAPALQTALWPQRACDEVTLHLSEIERRRQAGRAWAVLCEVHGRPTGFGQVARWGRRAEISDLVVAKGQRGQGVGSALIHCLLAIATREGFPAVEIGAALSNPRALALYRRLGFTDLRVQTVHLEAGPELVQYLVMPLEGHRLRQ